MQQRHGLRLRGVIGAALGLLAGLWVSLAVAGAAGHDAELAAPEGEVLLTVRGAIKRMNGDGKATFDFDMLSAMPVTEFATSTVWTDGVSVYTGVLLRDLLAYLGAEGGRVVASAIDGYHVVIPVDELHEDGPILAYLRDGAPMPVRDRGRLWVVYPYDENADFRNDTTYARSIWQVILLEVEE